MTSGFIRGKSAFPEGLPHGCKKYKNDLQMLCDNYVCNIYIDHPNKDLCIEVSLSPFVLTSKDKKVAQKFSGHLFVRINLLFRYYDVDVRLNDLHPHQDGSDGALCLGSNYQYVDDNIREGSLLSAFLIILTSIHSYDSGESYILIKEEANPEQLIASTDLVFIDKCDDQEYEYEYDEDHEDDYAEYDEDDYADDEDDEDDEPASPVFGAWPYFGAPHS